MQNVIPNIIFAEANRITWLERDRAGFRCSTIPKHGWRLGTTHNSPFSTSNYWNYR
jgi:hypothetical protein